MSPRKDREKDRGGVVVFDVDGTLVDGFMFLDFARYLSDGNTMDRRMLHAIEYAIDRFGRQGEQYGVIDERDAAAKIRDYEEFAVDVLRRYAEGIRGRVRNR